MSSPSSGYNSSGTGSGSQEDEGRAEDEEEERLLIDLSSPGDTTSVTLLGPSAGPTLINTRRSWTTFDDDDQNHAFNRYYPLISSQMFNIFLMKKESLGKSLGSVWTKTTFLAQH